MIEKTARINLLLSGNISRFDENAIQSVGHITPIFPHLLRFHLKNNKMQIIKEGYNRKYSDYLIVFNKKDYVIYIFNVIIGFFLKILATNKKNLEGIINIYIIRKL